MLETGSGIEVAGGWGGGEGELFTRHRVSVGEKEKAPENRQG